MSKICMRNCIVDKKKLEKDMKSSGGVEKKHVRLREPQHTPVEHSSGIPKAPNERNSDSRGRWFFVVMFHGSVGKFFETGILEL